MDVFDFSAAIILFVIFLVGGGVLANLLGYCYQNRLSWKRFAQGLVVIGFVGLAIFVGTDRDLFMTNGLTGLAIIGFCVRCLYEWALSLKLNESHG